MHDERAAPSPGHQPIPHTLAGAQHPGQAALLAAILVLGAFGVVLAGMSSPLFDLDRHAVPKELALHLTALLALPWLLAHPPSFSATALPGEGVRGRRIDIGLVGALLIGFAAWSATSSVFAVNRWLALRALGITFSSLVLFAAGRRIARTGHGRAVLAGLSAAAVIAAALGAGQAWGLDWEWLAGSRPPGGTFGNRNFLAHLLAISTPGIVLLCLSARSSAGTIAGLTGTTLIGGAIVLTRSRAAWLGLAAGLGIMLLASALANRAGSGTRRRAADADPFPAGPAGSGAAASIAAHARELLRPRAALVTGAMLLGIALAVLLPNRLEWRSDSPYSETLTGLANYREGSGRGRLIQYENTFALAKQAPLLGVGPGNWFVHYPRVTTPGDPAFAGADPIPTNPWPSSDWIAFLAERGVPGAALFLLAGVAAVLTAAHRLFRIPSIGPEHAVSVADERMAAAALLGTLTAAMVTGMFDAVLLLAPPAFFTFTVTGLLLPATRPLVSVQPRLAIRRTLSSVVVLFSVLLVGSAAGRAAAIRLAGDGRDRAGVERALRFDPGNHRLHLLLSRRGACRLRAPHARVAAELMPYHPAPVAALRACGLTPD